MTSSQSLMRVEHLAIRMLCLLAILLLGNSQFGCCLPYQRVPASNSNAETDSFSEVHMGSHHQVYAREDGPESSRSESVSTEPPASNEGTAGEDIYHGYQDLEQVVTKRLVEMDIVVTAEVQELIATGARSSDDGNQRQKKAALHHTFSRYYWPEGRVPYAFAYMEDPEVMDIAHEAMQHWMDHTCLKFVPREPEDRDYINFVSFDGCWSHIGKQGGAQKVSLGRRRNGYPNYCKSKGVVIHELGHAVGFWHEQSRPDRNDYIIIEWDNIIPGNEGNFYRYSHSQVNSRGVPYDYRSIMHYPTNAFSRNGRATIIPRQPGRRVAVGQRDSLSKLDIEQANLMYNCPVAQNTTKLVNVTATIPVDSFPIHSERFANICLDIAPWSQGRLYDVVARDCNATKRTQHWKWTNSDQILNVETFLCLASRGGALIVTACAEGDDSHQQWTCAGSYIEQLSTGRCLTLHEQALDHGITLDRVLMAQQNQGDDDDESMAYDFETELIVNVTNCGEILQSPKEQAWDSAWEEIAHERLNSTESEHEPLCPSNSSAHKLSRCYAQDMTNVTLATGNDQAWATCNQLGFYTSGFYHTSIEGNEAQISGMECCASDYVFTGQNEIPNIDHEEDCRDIEWWSFIEGAISESWFRCPRGMFLKGFSFQAVHGTSHQISKARCCKGSLRPVLYEHCYTEHSRTVANSGIHKCTLAGYHITSALKDGCLAVGDTVECNEEITCCMQQ